MDDEAAFLLQVAEELRARMVRTVVARRAYDQVADELTRLAERAEHQAMIAPTCDRILRDATFAHHAGAHRLTAMDPGMSLQDQRASHRVRAT